MVSQYFSKEKKPKNVYSKNQKPQLNLFRSDKKKKLSVEELVYPSKKRQQKVV